MEAVLQDTSRAAAPEDMRLPPLREDLGLFAGPRNAHGESSWILHDPVRNKYFRVGVAEFEMLSQWSHVATVGELGGHLRAQGVDAEAVDILQFVDFLFRNELTQPGQGASRHLYAAHQGRRGSLWQKLLHNYLFLRIPLVRPDPWLDRWYPLLRPLLSRRFLQVTVLVGCLALFLVLRQWELFWSTFLGFLDLKGMLAFGLTMAVVKVLHEAGHAIACRHHGLRVPSIGVVFIVMWPVMYTDATEAWRLKSRRARIAIAAAGMLTELSVACYATLLWVVLPDGMLRSMVFLLATTTWIMSLLVNLNPFMKFDGYYLFSDILDVPNLQERGFVLARNRLRHFLFGTPYLRDPGLDAREHRLVVAWAFGTWIYRFFLFLGIALLVYHFFFKALGIFLFIVEIWWFIGAPVWREMREWAASAGRMSTSRRRAWLAGGAVFALLLLLPWQSSFLAPALMQHAQHQRLYPVEAGLLLSVSAEHGQSVRAGDVLFELNSPDLDAQLAAARAEVVRADQSLSRVMSSVESSQDRLVAEPRLVQARTVLAGLEQRYQRMQVKAPFAGRVLDVPPTLAAGQWVGARQRLAVVAGEGGGLIVDAYVDESRLRFIKVDDEVRFYPQDVTLAPRNGRVVRIDGVDTRVLPDPYLAETHGGGILVRQDADGKAVPEQAIYRVRAQLADDGAPLHIVRGDLRFGGDSRSLLFRFWTLVGSALVRESGF